jgi:dihydrofolate reductase
MSKLRVEGFTISLDGFAAGPNQSLEAPLGVGGERLHGWLFPTLTLQTKLFGKSEGETGVDDDFAARGFQNVGAWIMGRNMFGPIRGPWPDDAWRGWWGENPVYHMPVYVLTHHARESIVMEGGTTFHFITTGIEDALARATASAAGKDVRVGGGAATIRQYLAAGLIDELHVAVAPVFLGSGERLFEGLDMKALGYACTQVTASAKATHLLIQRE